MMKTKKNRKINVLSMIILITIIAVIFGIRYYLDLQKQELSKLINTPVTEYLFEDGEHTNLRINILDSKSAEENTDICYDLIYLPDMFNAGEFVRQYYMSLSQSRKQEFIGDEWKGFHGSEETRVYRTNGFDKIIVKFYDGTNKTWELSKMPHVVITIPKAERFIPKYNCYFDNKLRFTNLTYEELNKYVCDRYEKTC